MQLNLGLEIPPDFIRQRNEGWTDQAVLALREYILIDALASSIDGRCSPETRVEMIEWIENDDIHPFSFRVCAIACGYDPSALRDAFRIVLKRANQGEIFEIHSLSGLDEEAA